MPRRRLPARLKLRKARADRGALWVIVDGEKEISTGVGADGLEGAQAALEEYLASKHRPPAGESHSQNLLVAEVIATYLREHASNSRSSEWIGHTAAPILEWWADKPLSEVRGENCRRYVAWRTAQSVKSFKKRPARMVSDQTARHELKTLRTAINYFHREYGLTAKPMVTLPAKAEPRTDYWLTRQEAAARIRVARSRPDTHHFARIILIGLYSGTRPGAIMRLRWLPSPEGGWIDVERGLLHRRGQGTTESKKRQPPAPLHRKLLLHARYWQTADRARGIASVIHYDRVAIKGNVKRSWKTVRKMARHPRRDSPHILRHTAATWLMQTGIDLAQIAGYLGMTIKTLETVYGHHHPNFLADAAQVTPGKRVARWGRK